MAKRYKYIVTILGKYIGNVVKIIFLIALSLSATSCLKENLSYEVYKSKKEVASNSAMASSSETIHKEDNNSLKWSAPKGWIEKETNSIRVGSYDLPNIGDKKGELSIIILAGDGGGIIPNLNRWRGQIGLTPSGAKEIENSLQTTKGKLGSFRYTQITNKDKSILAAFTMNKGKTIYIKASGNTLVLEKQKRAFIEFIKGIYESK